MTEISTRQMTDGKSAVCITDATITAKSDVKSGMSQRSGEPWKLVNINVCLNVEGAPMYMRLTARGEMVDRLIALPAGTKLNVFVRFDVTGAKWLSNDIAILNYEVQSF